MPDPDVPQPDEGSSNAVPPVQAQDDAPTGRTDGPLDPSDAPAEPSTEPLPLPAWPPPPRPIPPPPSTVSLDRAPVRPRGGRIVAGILAALVLLGSGIGIGWALTRASSSGSQPPVAAVQPEQPKTGGQDLTAEQIAAQVDPAIVDIDTVLTDGFGRTGAAAGTGMVVTSSGEVLTNNHVIEGATQIHVTVSGRSNTYTAHVVGVDPKGDVALLQIEGASDLSTVTFADSTTLHVGDEVVALGNALGRGGTPQVTEGAITALSQSIQVSDGRGGTEDLEGLIQIDASIQPGESGGPLVNRAGQVIGMITAGQRSQFSSSSSVGFAITSNAALHVVNEIRAGHESDGIIIGPPGFLGVGVDELDAATASQLGLAANGGVLVVRVSPDSPAAKAGISANSVITRINGTTVHSVDELGTAIRAHDPGEQISVTWVDQSGTHSAAVTLISGPAV
jgi:S1-C subfamily serine protease